jgi:hypothetical protein
MPVDRKTAALLVAALLLLPGTVAAVTATAPTVHAQPAPTLPDPQPTPEEARRQADEILSRSEYQEPPPSFVERIIEWILERLRDLFDRVPTPDTPTARTPGGGDTVLAWLVVAALVGLVVFLLTRWRRGASLRRRDKRDPLVVTEREARREPDEWLAEAERLEQAGHWKAALRCRFRALIGELIERGVVRDLPGRTSGEFRVEIRRSARDLAGPFNQASVLFDAAWYGDLPTGPAESATFQRLADEILAARPRPAEDDDLAGAARAGGST